MNARYSGLSTPTGERGHPVAVLEGQLHPEVPLQPAADGVRGQRPQQLAAFGLARRRTLWSLNGVPGCTPPATSLTICHA